MIAVYAWAISVVVTKLVDRKDGVAERYTKADRTIDLTPLLGDGGSISTTKTLSGDVAGAFSITFGDQCDQAVQDSVYAIVEPMDLIEIRASRNPHLFSGGDLPLIMRGFVSVVARSEAMNNGGPSRSVSISGHDAGKMWKIHQVWQEQATITEKPVLTAFGLHALLGLDVAVVDIERFMDDFMIRVVNQRVADLEAYSGQLIKYFIAEMSVTEGRLIPSVVDALGSGPYWSIVSAVADTPWNELFVRDEEDGPHFVFRPAPYYDIGGKLIMEGAKDPGTVTISDATITELSLSRADANVANFYWTQPGTSSLDTNAFVVAGSLITGNALDFQHGNNRPELYGARKMEVTSVLIPDTSDGLTASLPSADRPAENNKRIEWYQHRAQQLQAMNRDNVVFESGSAQVMGQEDFAIGKYLRISRGSMESQAYMTAVTHQFQPFGPWVSTLTLERGTGFLERNKETGSPYYLEGRTGPYSE